MIANRSIPPSTVIPVLAYTDPGEAIDWLCSAFGFTVRLRIANHRAQLNAGEGALVVTKGSSAGGSSAGGDSVMVRVNDVDAHHERARQQGGRVISPPTDYPYGERQYSIEDLAGRCWTFSQSIADVHPAEWGGTVGLGI